MKGDVLLNISEMKDGETVIFASKREDLFLNDKVESYELIKQGNGIYIHKHKAISFSTSINFNEKVKNFYANTWFTDRLIEMGLTDQEKEVMVEESNENFLIREGYSLRGIYENGVEFDYQNITWVSVKDT
jgi:hypothetical protein